ncbi:hypothetical protein K3729_07270 [Rhodobacteraceae bacterium S2214]|nr:hypothetical protein K3729_07270 [Rhodobacteraceae bacterium S2214]
MIEAIVTLFALGMVLLVVFWLFILIPAEMAKYRNRSAIIWVLISLLFSPFLAIFLLWVLGKKTA